MWLYKVIAFIGGFGFSSPKSGLKPRKGRGYAWNNWGNFQSATNMWRPDTRETKQAYPRGYGRRRDTSQYHPSQSDDSNWPNRGF